MLATLDSAMIDTILADNRYVSQFPDLMEARRRLALVNQADTVTGGCCGSNTPAQQAGDIRNILSWLKKTIANWPQGTRTEFLQVIGQKHLQIVYNDNGVVVTRVISR